MTGHTVCGLSTLGGVTLAGTADSPAKPEPPLKAASKSVQMMFLVLFTIHLLYKTVLFFQKHVRW
jgi:hypothetical protein